MDKLLSNAINYSCAVIGAILVLWTTAELHNSNYAFYNCITNSMVSSITVDSNNHKTIEPNALENKLPPCTTQANADYYYIYPQ